MLLALLLPLLPLVNDPGAAPVSGELFRLIGSTRSRAQVDDFYRQRGYTLAWTKGGVVTAQAAGIIGNLERAARKGLDPKDYDGSLWVERTARIRGARTEADLARFDLDLTVSLARYLSDLHDGRANPGLFPLSFDVDGTKSIAAFIAGRVVDSADVNRALALVEPPFEGYRRTEAALERYLDLAELVPAPAFAASRKPIEPGASYPAAKHLADLLRRLGDLPRDAAEPGDSYAEPLVAAVKHFQQRHGLDPDGRIGKATLAALNTPLTQRVRQLDLTLERWRWVPHSFARPPIVVNIPEFRLRASSQTYETELEMKVVVGKAFGHQTPVFHEEMKTVVFRPYWEVPPSILRAEIAPKLDRDRSYLLKNRFEVVTARGKVVSTGAVDDSLLERLRSGELQIRQTPGPENSLGLVKFLFPNRYNVYLHGTPAMELFSRTRRDFSHGCIRVEKPVDLAEWVLRGKPEWTREQILAAMNGDRTLQVPLDRPIPVIIVYATAVALRNGETRFFEDIYGEDARLEKRIAATSAARGPGRRE